MGRWGSGSVGALLLAECSNSAVTADFASETQETSTESQQPEFAKVGDTVPVDCVGSKCFGEFKVEEILLGQECKAPLVAEEIPKDMQLVQVSGILTATDKVTDDQGGEIGVTPDPVEAWDAENFKTTGEFAAGCDAPQDYELWASVRAMTGEKVRMYGAFLITEDAKVLGIGNGKFDLGEIDVAPESSTSEKAPESAQPAPSSARDEYPTAPTQPVEEPVIGYTEAPGQEDPHVMDKQIAYCGDPSIHETGTTFFTDGTSRLDAELCGADDVAEQTTLQNLMDFAMGSPCCSGCSLFSATAADARRGWTGMRRG